MFMHTEECVARPEKVTIDGRLKYRSTDAIIIWAHSILNGMLQLYMVSAHSFLALYHSELLSSNISVVFMQHGLILSYTARRLQKELNRKAKKPRLHMSNYRKISPRVEFLLLPSLLLRKRKTLLVHQRDPKAPAKGTKSKNQSHVMQSQIIKSTSNMRKQ
jgi:hypothetical protein